MRSRSSLLTLAVCAFELTACSSDIPLIADYKVYDLGGSNQLIMGGNGSVSVDRVKAFAIQKPLILVETGRSGVPGTCSYGVINSSTDTWTALPLGHSHRHEVVATIRAQGKRVMLHSCAVRP